MLLYFEETYGLTSEKKDTGRRRLAANGNCYHPIRRLKAKGLHGTEPSASAPACVISWGLMRMIMCGEIAEAFPCWGQSGVCSCPVQNMKMLCLVGGQGREIYFLSAFWQ